MANPRGRAAQQPRETNPDRPSAAMRKYADDALTMLFVLAEGAESEAVRVSAIKELLDRGFGKASTLIGADSEPVLTHIERVILEPRPEGPK